MIKWIDSEPTDGVALGKSTAVELDSIETMILSMDLQSGSVFVEQSTQRSAESRVSIGCN